MSRCRKWVTSAGWPWDRWVRTTFAIVLMAIPGPPVFDAETAEQIRTLLAKGGTSAVFLVTDDCQQAYKELASRGVEFQETPEERPYGIDAGFRDPSGNNFRLTQLKELG